MPGMKFPAFEAPSADKIWEYIIAFTTPLKQVEHDCSICLESIDDGTVRTRCGHEFHGACLATWNAEASSCPYCRQELYLVRYYGMPFHAREAYWLDEAMFEVLRSGEGGEARVQGFLVKEMGRWTKPGAVRVAPEPVVERVEEEVPAEREVGWW